MRYKDLYAQILDIKSSWQVSEVDLSVPKGEVTVRVEQKGGVRSCCPNGGKESPGHDTRTRRWRHLGTCVGNIERNRLKVSNGPAEGLSSRKKTIKVRSRGFRNKRRFANAIYVHLGGLDLYPEGVR